MPLLLQGLKTIKVEVSMSNLLIKQPVFNVWADQNTDRCIHVEIKGLGMVSINRTGEGVIIDVFDKTESNDSLNSLAIEDSEFSEGFFDALQNAIEKLDPSIDLNPEDTANAYENNHSVSRFIEQYFKENEFDISNLKPLKGEVKGSSEQVRDLQRPYIRINEAQYNTLKNGPSDFYLTKGNKVVTFGSADGGYALMPLNDEAAEATIAKQSPLNEMFHREYLSDENIAIFEKLGWELCLIHELSSAIDKKVVIERDDERGPLELSVKVNFQWETSKVEVEILKFDRGEFEKFDVTTLEGKPLHEMLKGYIKHLNSLSEIAVEDLELVGITEEYPAKWNELLASAKALSDTLGIE